VDVLAPDRLEVLIAPAAVLRQEPVDVAAAHPDREAGAHGAADLEALECLLGHAAAPDHVHGLHPQPPRHHLHQLVPVRVELNAALLHQHGGVGVLWAICESGVVAGHAVSPQVT
jgi:hypothetical protein